MELNQTRVIVWCRGHHGLGVEEISRVLRDLGLSSDVGTIRTRLDWLDSAREDKSSSPGNRETRHLAEMESRFRSGS